MNKNKVKTNMKKKRFSENKLIIANGNDPDLVYALGLRFNSPGICLIKKTGEKIALIPELELLSVKKKIKKLEKSRKTEKTEKTEKTKKVEKIKKVEKTKKAEANNLKIMGFNEFMNSIKEENKKKTKRSIITELLKQNNVKNFSMSPKTRAQYYKELIEKGHKIKLKELFPERRTKTKEEIKKIKKTSLVAMKAMKEVETILKKSILNNKKELIIEKQNKEKQKITSEYLKKIVTGIFEDNNCSAETIILSHGKQTSSAHDEGKGIIKEKELIIIDIFPYSRETGYFFDMTRTYCKNPDKEQKKLYQTVLKVQKEALAMIKPKINTSIIHNYVEKRFEELGYETKDNRSQGFTHSLGHGLGLEIHEEPRVGPKGELLKENDVITIEPGLYYKKLGGVRIEDTILVTKEGHINLTKTKKKLEV